MIEASKECDALSMIYDMISALTLAEGMFKKSGGSIEKEEGCQNQFFFADVIEPVLMKEKIEEIFAEKFTPKKITLAQLTRTKPEEENVVLK